MIKKLMLILVLLLFGAPAFGQGSNNQLCYTTNGNNCVPAIASYNSAKIAIASATTTEIVALVTGKQIYVTSWDGISSAAGTFKWVYGTGTACGTGQVDLTGAYAFGASTVFTKGAGLGAILIVPQSNALCVVSTGSINIQGSVSYSQF